MNIDQIGNVAADFFADLVSFAPTLLGAISILILGYLASALLSSSLRWLLGKMKLNERLTSSVSEPGQKSEIDLELWLSRGLHYLLLIFVLTAFFEILGLNVITEPLNALLVKIFEFIPRIIGPAILLLGAWVLATIVRTFTQKLFIQLKFDERFGESIGSKKGAPVSRTLANSLYWLIFLLFLPAILEGLAMGGLLDPVKGMLDRALSYIPNIFASLVILGLGWFAAKVIQRVVTNLLESIGIDHWSEKLSLKSVLGKETLSHLLGLIVYILVLIPVFIAALNALQLEAITEPASDMLNSLLSALPAVFGAVIILFIAYAIGRIVSQLATNLLTTMGFNSLLAKLGVVNERQTPTPADVAGNLVWVAILLFASIEALSMLHFDVLASLISQFLIFAAELLLGLVIFAFGLYFSDFIAKKVHASAKSHANLLAVVTRIAILILASAMALRQMGLAEDIINLAFGISLGAVAVAAALAFGLGGRAPAEEVVREWFASFRKKN